MPSIVALMRGTMWMPFLRITDREGEHVGEFPGAPVAHMQAPGIERAGHHRRQHAGPGNEIDAKTPESLDRGGLRRDALAADHVLRPRARLVDDDRRIAARPVEMRLRHLQDECRGRGGVEGIAASLQHRHADLAGDPVRAGDDAECAGDLGAGGEHAGSPLRGAQANATLCAVNVGM